MSFIEKQLLILNRKTEHDFKPIILQNKLEDVDFIESKKFILIKTYSNIIFDLKINAFKIVIISYFNAIKNFINMESYQ